MNISCKLGRSFSSIEAVNECADHHGGCAKYVLVGSTSISQTNTLKSNTSYHPKMFDCPVCVQSGIKGSVWYNEANKTFECLRCKRNGKTLNNLQIKIEIIGLAWNNIVETEHTQSTSELMNPLLLSVKMFLADVRVWRNKYREDEYVCSDFSREVVDRATERGMRCGLVTISFEKDPIGHAIVAFETDHGLIYIEPQTGEQVDVIIGRYYPWISAGISEKDPIKSVEIKWNDGTKSKIQ